MLSITLSPLAFELPAPDPAGYIQPTFCALVISFLRDIEENCVILVDKCTPTVTHATLTKILDNWPHKYRVEAKMLLTRLRERRRFVSIRGYSESVNCAGKACGHTVGLTIQASPSAVLMKDGCQGCLPQNINGTEILTFSNYPLSRFARLRREARRIGIQFGQITQPEAESRIFGPVMQYATHVKIVDRYIGRSVPARDCVAGALSRDYQRSIDWLIDIHQRSIRERGLADKATLEIWCGLDSYKLTPSDTVTTVAHLRAWELSIRKNGMPNFRLYIKKETHAGEMPHARYLITDQLTLLVDRGFELLCSDPQMHTRSLDPQHCPRPLRDCEIALLPDSSRVVTDIRRLEDL